jgi:hypothetical protein
MTGPEHYREAERLLAEAENLSRGAARPNAAGSDIRKGWAQHGERLRLEAQVHATLALAAATAYPAVKDYTGGEGRDSAEWTQATS